MSTIVKASFKGDCRRIKISKENPFLSLWVVAKETFPSLKGETFAVKYKDDEGDRVTIASNAEFAEAMEMYQSKILKVFLVVKSNDSGKKSAEKKSVKLISVVPTAEKSDSEGDYEFIACDSASTKTPPKPKKLEPKNSGVGSGPQAPKLAEPKLAEPKAEKKTPVAVKCSEKKAPISVMFNFPGLPAKPSEPPKKFIAVASELKPTKPKSAQDSILEVKSPVNTVKESLANVVEKNMLSANVNPSALFIEDVTLPDDQKVLAGSKLHKTWLLENNGKSAWPKGVELRVVRSSEGLGHEKSKPLSSIDPKKRVAVSVRLVAPDVPGKAYAEYGLFAGKKQFGSKFWVQVVVVKGKKSKKANKAEKESVKTVKKALEQIVKKAEKAEKQIAKKLKKAEEEIAKKLKKMENPIVNKPKEDVSIFQCDHCNVCPIVGDRYKKNNEDFDLCSTCFGKLLKMNKGEKDNFVKISSTKFSARELSVRFVRDVNFEDGTLVSPGQHVSKKWLLKNTGKSAWPEGSRIFRLRGNWPHSDVKHPALKKVQPGETVEAVALLDAPTVWQGKKKLNALFGLRDPNGTRIKGASFWVEVKMATTSAGIPGPKGLADLASMLFNDDKVVAIIQEEFPKIVADVKKGESFASIISELMKKHDVLAGHPFLHVLEPYFSMMEAHFRVQTKSMLRLLHKQDKMMRKIQRQAEAKVQHMKTALKTAIKKDVLLGETPASVPGKLKRHTDLRCKFVSDVTILDNSKLIGGSEVVKIWKLKNVGKVAWPSGTKLVKTLTSNFDCATHVVVADKDLPASGCEVSVSLPIKVPVKPGKYVATFRPMTKDGVFFGQKIWVSFIVNLDEEDKHDLKDIPSTATNDKATAATVTSNAKNNHEAELKKLAEMGFKDRELNLYLLGVYGDVPKTIAWLVANA